MKYLLIIIACLIILASCGEDDDYTEIMYPNQPEAPVEEITEDGCTYEKYKDWTGKWITRHKKRCGNHE